MNRRYHPVWGPDGVAPGAAGQAVADRPAAEGVEFARVALQRHGSIEEQGLEVVFGFSKHDLPFDWRIMRAANVEMAGIEGAVGPALVEEFQRQVEGALRAERQPDVGGKPVARAVAFAGDTRLQAGGGFRGILFQDDVDDAADGVGAVLGDGTVAQHFDAFDGGDRNGTQVDAGGALQGRFERARKRDAVPAFAVDEDQRVVGGHAAQQRAVKQAAIAKGVTLRVERGRHLLEGDGEIGRAGRGHLLDVIELHRNREVLRCDAAHPGADHDDIVQFNRDAGLVLGLPYGLHLLLLVLRRNDDGKKQNREEYEQAQKRIRLHQSWPP